MNAIFMNSFRRRFSVNQSLLNKISDISANAFSESRKWSFGPYARFLHQLGRVRDPNIRRYIQLCSPSRPLSTSSESKNPKVGLLKWYLSKLDSHPFITKSVTTSLIYMAADLTSQMITLPPSGSFDLMRTSRMAGFGLLFLGPSQHLWFNSLSKILPKRDVLTILKKILMGQVLFGPCSNTVFYSSNAALQGENGDEIAARLKRDLLPTLINGLMYWPLCDFVTFKFVPVHLQPLMNSSCAYVWTIYLTYMANLEKPSTEQ